MKVEPPPPRTVYVSRVNTVRIVHCLDGKVIKVPVK